MPTQAKQVTILHDRAATLLRLALVHDCGSPFLQPEREPNYTQDGHNHHSLRECHRELLRRVPSCRAGKAECSELGYVVAAGNDRSCEEIVLSRWSPSMPEGQSAQEDSQAHGLAIMELSMA